MLQMQPTNTSRKLRANSVKARGTGELLVEAAQQFALLGRPDQSEISAFKELFFSLIFKLSQDSKRQLSTALARSAFTPRTIAVFFSMESIEVAAPMLLFSPVLSDWHLNAILRKCPISHYRVIARRTDLQHSTVKNLLLGEDPRELTRTLLRKNPNIAENVAICDLLNMPVELVRKEFKELAKTEEKSTKFSKTTEEAVAPDEMPNSELGNSQLIETNPGDVQLELLELANKGGRISSLGKHVSEILTNNRPEVLEKQLLDCARKGNKRGFAQIIQDVCELPAGKTLDILERQDAGSLAGIFCALKFSRTIASQLLLLLNRNIGRDVTVFREVTKKFVELDIDYCRSALIDMGARFESRELPLPESRRALEAEAGITGILRSRREMFFQNTRAPEAEQSLAG